MCTASWLSRPGGYDLFFNRDERHERRPAEGPRVQTLGARRVIVPRDGDAGGTWIGVNEAGLALGLLNAWDETDRFGSGDADRQPRSRGLLVLDLLAAADAREVADRLRATDLSIYRGFHLLVIEPGSDPRVHRFTGGDVVTEPALAPLSSSSFDSGGARSHRAEQFRALALAGEPPSLVPSVRREPEEGADVLEAFHRSHVPKAGPYSVCMHRRDAATVSACHVHVDAGAVTFRYAPGPPCRHAFDAHVSLDRVAAPVRP